MSSLPRHNRTTPESGPPPPKMVDPPQHSPVQHQQHQGDHFSLRTWIRQQPWKQYFKDGCRLIVKSPLNFFIFFCCLSVVVWGAFLVLLLGNMVKLGTDAKQKLWIEIASQVLNGFFTLANVPVHPKRFLGFVRGCGIWREDKNLKKQFLDKFLTQEDPFQATAAADNRRNKDNKELEKERSKELLDRLAFYRCFPDYGKERLANPTVLEELETFEIPSDDKTGGEVSNPSSTGRRPRSASRADATVVVSRSRSRSKSISRPGGRAEDVRRSQSLNRSNSSNPLHPTVVIDMEPTANSQLLSPGTNGSNNSPSAVQVNIAEDDLNDLLAEETHRVVQSVVLPFLPFPLEMPNFSTTTDTTTETGTGSAGGKQYLPLTPIITKRPTDSTRSSGPFSASLTSPSRSRPPLELTRGASQANLSRISSTKRSMPRTRARTMTMSMASSGDASQRSRFVIHEDQPSPVSAGSMSASMRSRAETTASSGGPRAHFDQDPVSYTTPPLPPPFEPATGNTVESPFLSKDANKPDEKKALIPMPAPLTKEQMEWVDSCERKLLKRQEKVQRGWPWYNYTIPSGIEPVDFFADEHQVATNKPTVSSYQSSSVIMLQSSPSDLVIEPSRYLVIVGSFNLNSMIQEILCGFMWGMNYHVRPGWVTGVGMALGCMAAIVPSVMIMLHEQAMSKIRVVATAEEAIQDALDSNVKDTKL
ncbi:hypothetical protein EMPS_09095 [Entomortierella parvispora]|uniref:Uncharacterized protein n=1 Tax=Entomortierella parvispora TaxID=205924 RepID=A0A9P3LZQ5_9FUNG|nr:hypothetical protein EMPS_09095 [Entomortierella parvispora]